MANQRNKDAKLMAKALALFIITYPNVVDDLTAKYGYDTTQYDSLGKLNVVENLIQGSPTFRKEITDIIGQAGGQYRNAADIIGSLVAGIGGGIGNLVQGVTSGVSGIIDATSDSGKQVRQTMAQAELIKAQAQIEQAKANQLAAQRKQNLTLIVGVASGAMVLAITVFAYFKFRKK